MQDIYNKFKDFKSFEVSFVDDKKELQRLFCTVKNIENNRIILNANNNTNKNIFATANTPLQLYIYTEHGIYSAKSKVLEVTEGVINTEYIINYPYQSKYSQRREYFRADLHLNFQMKIFPTTDPDGFYFINGVTRNLCGKGMSFISEKPFPDVNAIDVKLCFEEKDLNVSAELVYTQPIMISGYQKFVNAFILTNISPKEIEFVIKQCFFHQLEEKRKGTV